MTDGRPRNLVTHLRFRPDVRYPYLARARFKNPETSFFIKRYDLSAWMPTQYWRSQVLKRCKLIESFTSGRTYFETDGKFLLRISRARPGLMKVNKKNCLSQKGYEILVQLVSVAHEAGVPHGDIMPRNLAAAGDEVDLFDWEPILVRPSHIPATEVAPAFASDPSRWLGGSDLLRLGTPRMSTLELDQLGLRLLMQRYVK